MKGTRIDLGDFRILGSCAIGKSQHKVLEDAGLSPNIGYKSIKRLNSYGIFGLSAREGNKIVLENVSLFHRALGEIMIGMANRENEFFQKFGSGLVIDSYIPVVVAAMIKPSVDAILGNKGEVDIDDVENLAALLKGAILGKIREEGAEKEVRKTIAYFEALGKEVKNGNGVSNKGEVRKVFDFTKATSQTKLGD